METIKQKTLKNSFSLSGKGLHTGLNLTVTFNPAPENTGYRIQRIDLEGQPIIEAFAGKTSAYMIFRVNKTSEAEANYWAYAYCLHSGADALRFCGYYSLFPHVATNVHSFMTEDYYAYWMRSILPEIRERYASEQAYWEALRVPVVDRVQSWLMDASLKHNKVSSGAREYSEVVRLILTMEAWEQARGL